MRETPEFAPNFKRYLQAHGWFCELEYPGQKTFKKGDMRLMVKGDTIDVFAQEPPVNPRKPYQHLCSFHGWPLLDDFNFMLLMHVMNVVPLKQFIRQLKQDHTLKGEAVTADQILEHFGVERLPVAY